MNTIFLLPNIFFMTNDNLKPPIWFWIVAAIGLLWNLAGVGAYLAQAYMSPEALAAMTDAERTLHESTPAWVTGAFAFAVFAGTLGCIALLLKKNLAITLFFISLLGVMVQSYHGFHISNAVEVHGEEAIIMPVLVIVLAIVLIWFSRMSKSRGWLS